MSTIWMTVDGRPLRGTRPPSKDWPHGSRQVIRRAMFELYFTQMSRFNASRRIRRAMAHAKMHHIYGMVKAEQLAAGVIGALPVPKETSWLAALSKIAKDIFKPWE